MTLTKNGLTRPADHHSKKKNTIWKRVLIVVAGLLIIYFVIIWFLVSAALIPSFMKKLPVFDYITRLCYGQQVQSEDIDKHIESGRAAYNNWLSQAKISYITKKTPDGYKLKASVFEGDEDSHVWVLLLHGYTGWKEAMYPYTWFYSLRGYHAVIPDLRAQGESEGDFIGMGYTDHKDCNIWLSYILDQDPDAEIIIHGQSMGAATALMMSGEKDLPENVRFIVSDASYTDAYSMFAQKAWEWLHIPAFPVVDSARLMLMLRGGYDLKKASPIEAVKKSSTPTLFIHGDEDAMISVHMSEKLHKAAACDNTLMIIEGAGHAQTQVKDPNGFNGAIREYIEKYITSE